MLVTEWQSVRKHIIGPIFFKRLNARIRRVVAIDSLATISVTLVKDETMRKLNLQWNNQNKPTDVLSFPFEEVLDLITPSSHHYLGEIVISLDTAVRQATEQKHSLRDEVAVLYVHGVLHLLGYDHQNSSQAKEMKSLEQKILPKKQLL